MASFALKMGLFSQICKITGFFWGKSEKKRRNIWRERIFALILHPLSLQNVSKKKEFFEKIYIDREVVQEASADIYIGTQVTKNEPSF